jgi:adenylosuccinate lyase
MIERYTLPEMGKVWSLENRYQRIVDVEMAVVSAQAELGKIPKDSAERIRKRARFDVNRIAEIEKTTHHDLIALLTNLAENVGADARYIHLGLTSYDVVDTALALMMKESLELIEEKVEEFLEILKKRAFEHKDTVMIGRTHGIHAEPITFGLKLCLWYAEMERNLERLRDTKRRISVGKISGAVGTYAHIDPKVEEVACKILGLSPAKISSQILQRDRHAEYLCTLAITASSLDKFAIQIRTLQRTEIAEAEEPFRKGQKGSSAMPHKKNPVLSERISGLARIVRANAQVGLENIGLWDERDISHSSSERVVLADSAILVHFMLTEFCKITEALILHPDRMEENLKKTANLIFSESLMLRLIEKGMSREEAYEMVQKLAFSTLREGYDFKEEVIKSRKIREVLSEEEIDKVFDIESQLNGLSFIFERVFGSTSPER